MYQSQAGYQAECGSFGGASEVQRGNILRRGQQPCRFFELLTSIVHCFVIGGSGAVVVFDRFVGIHYFVSQQDCRTVIDQKIVVGEGTDKTCVSFQSEPFRVCQVFRAVEVLQDAVALTDDFVILAPLVQVGGAVSEEILCDLSVGEIHAVIDIGRSASGQSVKSFVGRHRSRCVPVTDGLCLIREHGCRSPHIRFHISGIGENRVDVEFIIKVIVYV